MAPGFLKKLRSKDSGAPVNKIKTSTTQDEPSTTAPPKPKWADAWTRKDVDAAEVKDLLKACSHEMKSRGLDVPFLLLPFRPNADLNPATNFIRNFFSPENGGPSMYQGRPLQTELRLVEPETICSIMKWCWGRLKGGIVTWNTYNLFVEGEKESRMAKHAYDVFVPLSVESDARKEILHDFFDLLAAIAANVKANGMGGRKLSRLAGWWAFDHSENGNGFEGGYRSWAQAADATSHLFFAYLRSRAAGDETGNTGIFSLPRSLQALVAQTEYPPEAPPLLFTSAPKVVMIVDKVSSTPYSLLRRAKHFEYRDDNPGLQRFSSYDDPVQALTFECRRVLDAISSSNQPSSSVASGQLEVGSPTDASWSMFENIGFTSVLDVNHSNDSSRRFSNDPMGPTSAPGSGGRLDINRPTTPSWADFMSAGFADDASTRGPASLLLPPEQILPPITPGARAQSSQSHVRGGLRDENLEPGELASISNFDLDETFWWVWMSSLANEEPVQRKAVFGRCAFIETDLTGAKWMVIEEQVKGAAAQPEEGAMLVEKKAKSFTFGRKSRSSRQATSPPPIPNGNAALKATKAASLKDAPVNKTQQQKVQKAAADLIQVKENPKVEEESSASNRRRGRSQEGAESKTNSVMTLGMQPTLQKEALPAMQWARKYDREVTRAQYLGDDLAGKGVARTQTPSIASTMDILASAKATDPEASRKASVATANKEEAAAARDRQLPPAPIKTSTAVPAEDSKTVTPATPAQPIQAPPLPPPDSTKPETSAHKHTQSEKTIVSPDDLNHTTRKPVKGSLEQDRPDTTDHPAFRAEGDQKVADSSAKAKSGGAGTAAAAAAAAAWSPKKSDGTKEEQQPAVKSKKGSTRGIKSIFTRKKADDPEPEALAMHRQISTQKLQKKGTSPESNRKAIGGTPDIKSKSGTSEGRKSTASARSARGGTRISNEPMPEESIPAETTAATTTNADLAGEPGPEIDTKAAAAQSVVPDQRASVTGPLEDQPASVPMGEAPESPVPAMPTHAPPARPVGEDQEFQTAAGAKLHANTEESLMRSDIDPRVSGNAAAGTVTEGTSNASPYPSSHLDADDEVSSASTPVTGAESNGGNQARWAQIRQNAASRRSEDQSHGGANEAVAHHPSMSQSNRTDKTDDGETSGEETIESRVARIRARVAQLTSTPATGEETTTSTNTS